MRSWKVAGKYPVLDDKGAISGTAVTLATATGSYATFTENIVGNLLQRSDEELIQLALDAFYKAEYADKAIAESVQKVDSLEAAHRENQEAIESNKALISEVKVISDQSKAIAEAVTLIFITESTLDPTNYKRLVDLIDSAQAGKVYQPYDIFALEDAAYTPKFGEGTRVLVQVNKNFTYQGQSVADLEGELSQNGVLAVWRWTEPKE